MILKKHNDQSDDRKGKPSASSFHRMMNCEASQPLIAMLSERGTLPPEHPDEITESGTRAHDWAAYLFMKMVDPTTPEPVIEGITTDDKEEAEQIVAIACRVLQDVFGDNWEDDDHHVYIEQRFWINHEGELVSSGKFDLIVQNVKTGVAVVIDYKTGWADTPQGERNWQLIGAAVMVNQDLWAETVHVAIVETHAKIVVAEMGLEAIEVFRSRLIERILSARTGDPIRLPYNPTYKNCRYCPAVLRCPMAIYQTEQSANGIFDKEFTDDMLEELKDACDTAKIFDIHVTKEMAHRAASGTQFFNYEYSSSPGKRKIEDVPAVLKILLGLGAKGEDIFAVAKIGVGDAEKLHKSATGLKGKGATEDFNSKFISYIVKDTPAPSIKRR